MTPTFSRQGCHERSSSQSFKGLSHAYHIANETRGRKKIIVALKSIYVNDPFVMKAWAITYPENNNVKFLADSSAIYTHALGLELDIADKGLGIQLRRFALLVDYLMVKIANIEGGAFTISGAEEILKAL
ncbi:hypothetical protein ZIOFF_034557 [Zingiber officinale]|uniref:glutaredoxin-dependent peroxiredoxin n=1 Tax=Zingiber officinale TaxID=94328 RepID=A0A8J5LCZ0_ZINOF|nr:hypothetical protein ZIOFF_034557 [Zingiber officinale]